MNPNPMLQKDTAAWTFFAWASFALAVLLMCLGIYYMSAQLWEKGYLVMGLFFTIGSTFTLSKSIRDRHENERFEQIMERYELRNH